MNKLEKGPSKKAAAMLAATSMCSAFGGMGGLAAYRIMATNEAVSVNKELNLGLSKKECSNNSDILIKLKDFIYSGNNGGSIDDFVSYLEKKDNYSNINYSENEDSYSLNYTLKVSVPVYGYEKGYSDKFNKYRVIDYKEKQVEKFVEVPKSTFSFSFSFSESQKKIFKDILRESMALREDESEESIAYEYKPQGYTAYGLKLDESKEGLFRNILEQSRG